MVEKSTIWIALPHPYRWSTVEIVTQNPVDGRKIDHLDFSSTTHQWSTVEITTRNPVDGRKIDHLDFPHPTSQPIF
ncbi:hypothetical protein PGTUg99_018458 [Puccinia graminis f. sp. tritici]|uniref:Uncharacterized protein n=1 Tax=Puccinia graminis f. sp. tritici TaxID=56615 RepID=A0A5B0Q7M7_PUCGR|nr:hypothetical protein PGTUg99_018458 [Puccinia graminis f. sp. tritici]